MNMRSIETEVFTNKCSSARRFSPRCFNKVRRNKVEYSTCSVQGNNNELDESRYVKMRIVERSSYLDRGTAARLPGSGRSSLGYRLRSSSVTRWSREKKNGKSNNTPKLTIHNAGKKQRKTVEINQTILEDRHIPPIPFLNFCPVVMS